MSHPETTKQLEQLAEVFDIAIADDYEFQGAAAVKTLEPLEFYLFCKDDRWDLIDWDEIYQRIEEVFLSKEECCYDIRELFEEAYNTCIDRLIEEE